jgi:hypothetical protein
MGASFRENFLEIKNQKINQKSKEADATQVFLKSRNQGASQKSKSEWGDAYAQRRVSSGGRPPQEKTNGQET